MNNQKKIIIIFILIIIFGGIIYYIINQNLKKTNEITDQITETPEITPDLTIQEITTKLENNISDAELEAALATEYAYYADLNLKDERVIQELLDNQVSRVCSADGVPPCKPGLSLQEISDPAYYLTGDPKFKETDPKYYINGNPVGKIINCCVYDPNRNDPEKVQSAIDTALEIVKQLPEIIGINILWEATLSEVDKILFKNAENIAATDPTKAVEAVKNFDAKIKNTLSNSLSKSSNKTIINPLTKKFEKYTANPNKLETKLKQNDIELKLKTTQTNAVKNSKQNLSTKIDATKSTVGGSPKGQNFLRNSALNISDDIGAKVGGKVGTNILSGLSPLAHISGALSIIGIGLDIADPLGLNSVPNIQNIRNQRDVINRSWNLALIKQGLIPPLISGPLDNLPYINEGESDPDNPQSILEIHTLLQNEYAKNFTEKVLSNITYLNNYSPDEQLEIVSKLNNTALEFFNTQKGQDYLGRRTCQYKKGIYVDSQCSYRDKTTCENSYNWSKIVQNMNNPELWNNNTDLTYVEWQPIYKVNKSTGLIIKNNSAPKYVCMQVSPQLKSECPNGSIYNPITQLCDLTCGYCKSKGMHPNDTGDGVECQHQPGQTFFHNIFGTTIVQGVTSLFDKNC